MNLNFNKKLIAVSLIYFFPIAYVIGPFTADLSITCIALLYLASIYNKFSLIKFEKYLITLIVFWIYLIISSMINLQHGYESLGRSVTFLRFIVLIMAIQFFIDSESKIKKFTIISIITLSIVGLDLFIQSITSYNLLGFRIQRLNTLNENIYLRPSGFFREELIAGSYFLYFSIITIFSTYHLKFNKIEIKMIYQIFILFIPFFILLAGERMAILYLFGIIAITIIFSFKLKIMNKLFLKYKTAFITIIFITITFLFFFASNLINRFDFIFNISLKNCSPDYLCLFESAFKIYIENPLFGVGLKNFREVCDIIGRICSSHPHNLYFELLSETGSIGFCLFLIFIIFLYKNIIQQKSINSEYFFFGIIIIFAFFWPFSASRSYFSNYNASLIWFNLGMAISIFNLSSRKS